MIPTKTINIDFWRQSIETLYLVQGEADGRKVQFKITDNGVAFNLTGYTVQLAVKKPDGNIVVNSATITDAEAGIVETVISSQVVAVAGNLHAELHLMKEGQLSKTFRIVAKVASGVDIDGIEPSVSEFNALQTLIGEMNTAMGAPPSALTTTAKTLVGAINELEENLDKIEANNSLSSAQISSTYFSSAWVYKVGRLLFFIGTMTFTTQVPASVSTVIGTIPEGYRPIARAQVLTHQPHSSRGFAQISLNVDGTMTVYQYGTEPLPVNGAIQLNMVAISAN